MPDQNIMVPPPVLWAQRANIVYLSVCLEDCQKPEIKIEEDKVYFKGTGGTEKKEHEVTMNLYREVVPGESKYVVRDRLIEIFLKKKEEGPYWQFLLKDKKKNHWLKVDFQKWRDEDDSDDEGEGGGGGGGGGQDLEEMMRQIGGLGGAGGGDKPDLNDIDGNEDDSDDDDIPELES